MSFLVAAVFLRSQLLKADDSQVLFPLGVIASLCARLIIQSKQENSDLISLEIRLPAIFAMNWSPAGASHECLLMKTGAQSSGGNWVGTWGMDPGLPAPSLMFKNELYKMSDIWLKPESNLTSSCIPNIRYRFSHLSTTFETFCLFRSPSSILHQV